ncbi:MAG: putative glycolipid-binding domain-containing protein [Rubrivivax sp.]|nr:putative glycolipid-binding domain-containing protein [Pyrinomonadaceae bacterium]
MERHAIWTQWSRPGLEHLHLACRGDEVVADGIILGVENGMAFRLRYEVRCDSHWIVRRVRVSSLSGAQDISLAADGEGHWSDASGKAIHMLDGCLDVDISATPFTNTLPIRRLALKPGESSDLKVAYIAIPEMQVTLERQRYTCLAVSSVGGEYRFESLDSSFTADLPVDADGLVEDYPTLFRRVWSD